LQEVLKRYQASEGVIESLRQNISPDDFAINIDGVVENTTSLTGILQELSLFQARARLESVALNPIDVDVPTAIQIAKQNRRDWMNNRASLVDTWRLITFNANALQSNLDITFSGDLSTIGDNPVKFRGPTGSMQAGLRFDAPFTRLLERNNYRQVLIDYDRARRGLILFRDGITQSMRVSIRNLHQLETNLEIQREAVIIAVRRVDQTREALNEPPPPAQPGQLPAQLGPTVANDQLSALNALRDAQNNFMSVWLNYYASRMAIIRDMGIFELDEEGIWIDRPFVADQWLNANADCELPPSVPLQWLNDAGVDESDLPPGVEELPQVPTTAIQRDVIPTTSRNMFGPPSTQTQAGFGQPYLNTNAPRNSAPSNTQPPDPSHPSTNDWPLLEENRPPNVGSIRPSNYHYQAAGTSRPVQKVEDGVASSPWATYQRKVRR